MIKFLQTALLTLIPLAATGSAQDLDGDGYSATTSSGGKGGDTRDNYPGIHPRQPEVFGNGIDDNCNGRIDEPEFLYSPSGWDVSTDGFFQRINDSRSVDPCLDRGAMGERTVAQSASGLLVSSGLVYESVR